MQAQFNDDLIVRIDGDGSARLPADLCARLGAEAGQTLRVWVEGDVIEICAEQADGSMRRFAHWRAISEDLVAEQG